MCASYKHASLLAHSVSSKEKSFVRMPPGVKLEHRLSIVLEGVRVTLQQPFQVTPGTEGFA
jgi:hypothetical protein